MLLKEASIFQADETQIKARKDDSYWVSKPTIRQRNKWVEENLGLARQCAHRWYIKCHLPYDELEQIAFLALIGATERFDKSKGFRFSTFAVPIINGRLINYLRDKGHTIKVPRKAYDNVQRSKRVERKLETQLNRKPTNSEIALEMGVTLEQLNESRNTMQFCKNQSPEESLRYHEKSGIKLATKLEIHADLSRLSPLQSKAVEIYFSNGKALALGISSEELTEVVRGAIGLVKLAAAV